MKKILIILTTHSEMVNNDRKTGLWIGEFTDPYYEFLDQGYEVALVSPKGGEPPIDPLSRLTINIAASNRRFEDDKVAQQKFKNTQTIETVNASEFEAVFIPGGHGPLWDLATNEASGHIILDFFAQNKLVATVCHGAAALIKAAELQPGLLDGKSLTGFSNTEEKLAYLDDKIPYLLEDRLKELGADYHKSTVPYAPYTEMDGLLITGQNPLSAGPTARLLIRTLAEKVHE